MTGNAFKPIWKKYGTFAVNEILFLGRITPVISWCTIRLGRPLVAAGGSRDGGSV